MQIIVVGCGKVGHTLAERLSGEGHNLVLVDLDAKLIQEVTDELDVMGVVGNGASINVLMEAGIGRSAHRGHHLGRTESSLLPHWKKGVQTLHDHRPGAGPHVQQGDRFH